MVACCGAIVFGIVLLGKAERFQARKEFINNLETKAKQCGNKRKVFYPCGEEKFPGKIPNGPYLWHSERISDIMAADVSQDRDETGGTADDSHTRSRR